MISIVIIILIIIYILYVLFIKYSYTTENFRDNNIDNNHYGLIKYSSFDIASQTISDIHKLEILLNNFRELFYVKVIDSHINNINDLINKIDENIQETIRKTSKQYLNDNIYVAINPTINEINITLTKIIIIYPNLYENNKKKIIDNNNMIKFNQYFKENNFGGNITVFKIDKTNKIFSQYLQ